MDLVVLIIGDSLLGRAVADEFRSSKHEVVITSDDPNCASNLFTFLDVENEEEIRKLIAKLDPDAIVYTNNYDNSKTSQNQDKINVDAIRIATEEALKLRDCFVVYISSDQVFDGENGPYKPNAKLQPVTQYGTLRANGEQALWTTGHKGGVLRISSVYGNEENMNDSFASSLVEKINSTDTQQIDNYHIKYPIFVSDVAKVTKGLIVRRMKHCNLSGTWHFGATKGVTDFELAQLIASKLNKNIDHLQPINDKQQLSSTLPHNPKLDSTAIKLMGISSNTTLDKGIDNMLQSLKLISN